MKNILVIGAKGLAKEILFSFQEYSKYFTFYDDKNNEITDIYGEFNVLKNENDLKMLYDNKPFQFVIGVGGSENRELLFDKFITLDGIPKTLISSDAKIGRYDTNILDGTIVMDGALITNSVNIGRCTLINKCVIISHDVTIGDFCDISPSAMIMGNAIIGDKVEIGTGAIIIPQINIGKNVTIGAGAVIIEDIPNNAIVVGNPGKIIKIK